MTNVYLMNTCFHRSVPLSEKEDLWNELNEKFQAELEEEWICEESNGDLLFFPEFESFDFEDGELAIPYDLMNSYGAGQEVTSCHFYSICKGTNWTLEQDPRPDEFYFLLQRIFGDYWFDLLFVDDEDEARFMIEVTENRIIVTDNN